MRREWIQRIIDHDGTAPGTGGIELWIRLGVALGVPREEMEDERHVLPAARLICESYVTFCRTKPWVEAVASSLTELFAPKIHQQRIEAFPKHYPWIPPEALDYFQSRLVQAPRDVQPRAVDRAAALHHGGDPARAFEALAFKLEMLWALIDTIHNAYREEPGVEAELLTPCPEALEAGPTAISTPCGNGPVLLYPEGAVLLNDTGEGDPGAGGRTPQRRARSLRILGERYQADVTADVTEYLSHLAERELIRDG